MRKVYAVLSVKNRKKETLKCLECLKKQTSNNIETVLVDDGSDDGLVDVVRKDYPEVIILKGNGDLWFTASMNYGLSNIMKKAQSDDYILLLNNDVVFGEKYVEQLVGSASVKDKICIGSIAKSLADESIMYVVHKQRNGVTMPIKVELENTQLIFDTDSLNTRGTLVPVNIFNEIGLLSKLFPQYGSDYDFFYRAKRAGYKLAIDPKATIYSQDDDKGLSGRIREKKKISLKEFFQLFFSRRSSFNLYSRMLLVLLYTPFPQKIYTLFKILLNVPYVFFKKVL